jgi:hypothetical protein
MSHTADGLIGTTTHHNSYIQTPPMYGAPQYLQPYGGPFYYPPPPYHHSYHFSPPPPMSGPLSAPMMRPTSQPSSGSPSTLAYNLVTSENDSLSYAPYGSFPQKNLYFPFPSPPQLVSPPHGKPHIDVNFFHPSPIQHLHTFEKLNTENLAHKLNNSKKKGKNKTIITQDQVEITPNKTNLLGATKTKVTRTPKGPIKTNTKRGTTTTTSG